MKKLYRPVIFAGDKIEAEISKYSFRTDCTMLRTNAHMTKKDVSKVSGLSMTCVSDIEIDGNPTLSSLIKYLDCFGCELAIREKS